MKKEEKTITSISVRKSTLAKGKELVEYGEFRSFSHAIDTLVSKYYEKIMKDKK